MVDFQTTHQHFKNWLQTKEFESYFAALAGSPGRWQLYFGIALIASVMGIPVGIWLIWKWRRDGEAWKQALAAARSAYDGSQLLLCTIVACDRALLKQPGAGVPALLLGSFAPYSDALARELVEVARKLAALKGQNPANVEPTLRAACELVNDEDFEHERRRKVPRAIAPNTQLTLFEAYIDADFWGAKPTDFPFVVCIAEPGEEGSIQQIPDRVVAWTT